MATHIIMCSDSSGYAWGALFTQIEIENQGLWSKTKQMLDIDVIIESRYMDLCMSYSRKSNMLGRKINEDK